MLQKLSEIWLIKCSRLINKKLLFCVFLWTLNMSKETFNALLINTWIFSLELFFLSWKINLKLALEAHQRPRCYGCCFKCPCSKGKFLKSNIFETSRFIIYFCFYNSNEFNIDEKNRSSYSQMFFKVDVLKYFGIFRGKHLWQVSF